MRLAEIGVDGSDAAGEADSHDEANADCLGVGVEGVGEIDTAFNSSGGRHCGWSAGVNQFGDTLEHLSFAIEGGDGEYQVGVARFGVGGGGPVGSARVNMDDEAVGVSRGGFECDGNAVVDHGAGVGGDDVRHETA